MPENKQKDTTGSIERINAAMITHAKEVAREIDADAVLVYVDVIKSERNLKALINESRCILAARSQEVIDELLKMEGADDRVIQVPYMDLTRLSQIKVVVMMALSIGVIQSGDLLVCLSGSPTYGILDNLMVMEVGREFEVFSSKGLDITDHIGLPHVFDRLLTIAMELSEEGKEGKPLGTIFVLGDHERVMELSSQMVINPFGAVPDAEKNILDTALKETIREFATIDGAFVIRDDGVVVAAGRHLKASTEESDLPQGLGARHRAAAGITSLTNALAVAISESTGDVRVFSAGKIFMEIERRRRETEAEGSARD
ncbi:MAG: DNA integrity scanning protein DisA nucleotide-binding domain protein [Deltaproteobacteria bacterium]|nr:DNA integrity scanning protein DisA nucleotide-binding domain protein [Deltaproteobacteria bacterium]MBW1794882.1 DNA integrity scanning protein DisA nucleotide-binding domain protein [Deltaproteobacteria bacterium]